MEKQLDYKNGLKCQNILQKKENKTTYATVTMFRINWGCESLEMKLLQYGTDFTVESRMMKYLCQVPYG